MYHYEFVTINAEAKKLVTGTLTEHQAIINDYGKKGYRFVTAIPIETNANGYPRKFDLVFEKEDK